MSVQLFLDKVAQSDESVEANVSTIFQSIRGTKQYWFLRSSELRCMLREWGSPTLFRRFSAYFGISLLYQCIGKTKHPVPSLCQQYRGANWFSIFTVGSPGRGRYWSSWRIALILVS